MFLHPSQLSWIRSKILDAVPSPDQRYPKHIYISRSDAHHRKVSDREAVLSALPSRVEPVELERLSFVEQVQLFQQVESVIAPHGAGLTNILWGEDIDVVEIFGDRHPRMMYYQIAALLDHSYACISFPETDDEIRIDADELSELVTDHTTP